MRKHALESTRLRVYSSRARKQLEIWRKILGTTCTICGKKATRHISKGQHDYNLPIDPADDEGNCWLVTAKIDIDLCEECSSQFDYYWGNWKDLKESKFSKFFKMKQLCPPKDKK